MEGVSRDSIQEIRNDSAAVANSKSTGDRLLDLQRRRYRHKDNKDTFCYTCKFIIIHHSLLIGYNPLQFDHEACLYICSTQTFLITFPQGMQSRSPNPFSRMGITQNVVKLGLQSIKPSGDTHTACMHFTLLVALL